MKKNYYLGFAMLLCFFALGLKANAQASSITELYGKWQFTATVETTEYGQQYADKFAAESEVTITKDPKGIYSAEISGFAGGNGTFSPYEFYADTQILHIKNAPAVWNGLAMSFAEGGYPYSVDNFYSELEWTYDATTKTLTIPAFTLVAVLDHNAETAETVAKFTNCKMVQTEAEFVEIPSIAGDYNFEPDMNYVRNDSTFTYNFSVSLVATDDTNGAYDATVTFEGYEPINLPATFDGLRLTINYSDVWFDVEKKIYLGVETPAAGKEGALTFNYISENVLLLWDAIYVREDSVWNEENEKWSYPVIQKWSSGYLIGENEDTQGFSWTGTYNVISECEILDEELAPTFGEWPTEFQIVITDGNLPGTYTLKEFLGKDVDYVNYALWGSSVLNVEDEKTLTLSLTQTYGGKYYFDDLGGGSYLQMYDGEYESTSLKFTLNDDGTISVSSFVIQKTSYSDPEVYPIVMYQGVKAEKAKFNWFDTFTLTADVESLNGAEYPATFLVRFGDAEVYGATYNSMVAEFLGFDNLTSNNYGSNSLTVAEDTESATMPAGIYAGGSYPKYFKIYDINGSTSDLNFVVNADGTISMDDFIITTYNNDPDNWSAPAVEANAAKYTNVVLTRGIATGIESVVEDTTVVVKGIFDLMGRKYDEITTPGIYIVNGKKVVVK